MRGLEIRVMLANARTEEILAKHDLKGSQSIPSVSYDGEGLYDYIDIYHATLELGNYDAANGHLEPPIMFRDEVTLLKWWREGFTQFEEYQALLSDEGTEEEWEALSEEEKDEQWDIFHDLKDRGIADEMYFYRVLMNKFLVGYVGD